MIVPELVDLIGTPYEEINCWELVVELYKRAGVELEDYNISVDATRQVAAAMEQEKKFSWEQIKSPEPMCAVAMYVTGKVVAHCGIFIGENKFMHSVADNGVIITKLSDPLWKNKIQGFYKYVG